MKIKWNAAVLQDRALVTAMVTYLLVVGVVPVLMMALLGVVQVLTWAALGSPHPWGVLRCLSSYVFLAIPWLVATVVWGFFFFVITIVLAVARQWAKFSLWTPLILVFPLVFTIVGKMNTVGVFIALAVSVGFGIHWLAFSQHHAIAKCPRKTLLKRGAIGLIMLIVLVSFAFLVSFWTAKRLVDGELTRNGFRTHLIRASFVVDMDCARPCWVFRYLGLARIYVSMPEYEVFQSSFALNPLPLFGVLP